jgi:hypothetical protein
MESFTAEPPTITDGDTFTLKWKAPCGYVSLAQKGKAQFALSQPSEGSYTLRPDFNGYPTATGDTVYEATNGDVARRLYATVTVNPRPTATPSGTATPTPIPTPTDTGARSPGTATLAPGWSHGSPPTPTDPSLIVTAFAHSHNRHVGRKTARRPK